MKRLILVNSMIICVLVIAAKSVEPLQDKYNNRISSATFVDSGLANNGEIARNQKGDKLHYMYSLGDSTFYAVIKMADESIYYGLVYAHGKAKKVDAYDMYSPFPYKKTVYDAANSMDVLNGLKLIGTLVSKEDTLYNIRIFQTQKERLADIKNIIGQRYRNVHLWDKRLCASEYYDEIYSFYQNNTGQYVLAYDEECDAPQIPAGGRRGGGRGITKVTRLTGGYGFVVKAKLKLNAKWKTKNDTLIISYGQPNISVTAEQILPELYSNDKYDVQYHNLFVKQIKADFPTNVDVQENKKRVRSYVKNRFGNKKDDRYRFLILPGGDLVLFPILSGGCDHSKGQIYRIKKDDQYIKDEYFNLSQYIDDGISKYRVFRNRQVSSNEILYNKFTNKAIQFLDYVCHNPELIDDENKITKWLCVRDTSLDDGLTSLKGITDYSIFDINPNNYSAKIMYIRNENKNSQICGLNIHFDDNGIIIKDDFNTKFVKSGTVIDELIKIIDENNILLTNNKNNKKFSKHFKKYQKEYKKDYPTVEFKTFDELDDVIDDLKDIISLQDYYLSILNGNNM